MIRRAAWFLLAVVLIVLAFGILLGNLFLIVEVSPLWWLTAVGALALFVAFLLLGDNAFRNAGRR